MGEGLSQWMLVTMRDFVIKHKAVLRKVIIWYAKSLPEPTIEDTPDPTKRKVLEPNSRILLEIRDKFFSYYANPGREELFKAAWKIAISECEKGMYYRYGEPSSDEFLMALSKVGISESEHDPHYRDIGQWLLEELVERVMSGEWKPRPSRHPSGFWNEPRTPEGDYGRYHGRQFAKLIKK